MTPTAAISMLDRQLSAHGEDIRLQIAYGTQKIPFEVKCRAFVRGYSADELVAGITQSDSKVIISPTEIDAQGWPGPGLTTLPHGQDRRIPVGGLQSNETCFIKGKARKVKSAQGIYLAGVLVRIEMSVLG